VSIVIVEDDANVAQLLAHMFRKEGYEPVLLPDGRAAEEHVASHPPAALVVLDVMLPYRDGFAVAATIRGHPRWKDVPVLMLTARSLATDVEHGRSLGVNAYVSKPFQPRALVGRVKSLLEAGVT
jgi:two-component system alkaline phosphatase synthesis response regulator PhoP